MSDEECIINISDSDDYDIESFDSEENDQQMELIYDTYSVEQDEREEILLPKVNVKNMYTSKIPSITDLYCRKRQVALFKKRDQCAELTWQYHVLMSSCEKNWSSVLHLKMLFYAFLFKQRKVELEIVNLQIQKGMVGFQETDMVYQTAVIAYNNVNHFSKGKLKEYEPFKSDSIKTLTTKLDRLLVTLEELLKLSTEQRVLDTTENQAKRLSLLIININKIVVVLYVSY